MTDAGTDEFAEAEKIADAVEAAGLFDNLREHILANTDLCVDEDTNQATGDTCAWIVTNLITSILAFAHGHDSYDVEDDPEEWFGTAAAIAVTLAKAGWLGIPTDLKEQIETDRAAYLAEIAART